MLFVGAGASKPFGTPDMAELYDRCDHVVRSYPSAQSGAEQAAEEVAVWSAVTKYAPERNIEAMLRVLSLLSSDEFPAAHRVGCEVLGCTSHRQITPRTADACRRLRDRVTRTIVDQLQPRYLAARIGYEIGHRPYEALSDALEGLGPELVATTNYDTNLETYATALALYDGFDSSGEWHGFSPDASARGTANSVDYVKLHGSVNWCLTPSAVAGRVTKTNLAVGARPVGADGSQLQPYLILPADPKDRLPDPVAFELRKRFWDGLMRAELAVVVGYSFRDEYMSMLFLQALHGNKDLRLLVVDPKAEAIRNLFVGLYDEQVSALPTEFGGAAFANEFRKALCDELGYALIQPPQRIAKTPAGEVLDVVPDGATLAQAADTLCGRAIAIPNPQYPERPVMAMYGPYARLGSHGDFIAFFRLRCDGAEDLAPGRKILVLQVAARQAARVKQDEAAHIVAERWVTAEEACPSSRFHVIPLHFTWNPDAWQEGSLELRIIVASRGGEPESKAVSRLWIDTRWVRKAGPPTGMG